MARGSAEPVGRPPGVPPQYRTERVGPERTDSASPTLASPIAAREAKVSEPAKPLASRLLQAVDFVVVGLLGRIIVGIIEGPWLLLFAASRGVWRLLSRTAARTRAAIRSRQGVVLSASASVLLLLGAVLDDWPHDYYTLLRFVVFATALYLGFIAYREQRDGWIAMLGIVALLFNPVAPVRLQRATWQLVDVAVALVFAAAASTIGRRGRGQGLTK